MSRTDGFRSPSTTVAQSQSSPANDEQITYNGGAGEVFTIDANGELTIDTHAAQKVVFKDSAGQTFSATVTGTGRGEAEDRYQRYHPLLPL